MLTAAHCIAWGSGALKLRMLLGDHDLHSNGVSGHARSRIVRRVRKIKMHASYNTTDTDFDLALIEMNRPVTFRRNVRPVCLPEAGQEFAGREAVVAGWGRTSWNGLSSSKLKNVIVKIISNHECKYELINGD